MKESSLCGISAFVSSKIVIASVVVTLYHVHSKFIEFFFCLEGTEEHLACIKKIFFFVNLQAICGDIS